MNRIYIGFIVAVVLATTVAVSRNLPSIDARISTTDLQITTAEKNPWTGLKLNNDPDQFQFVIVTDRTGGHRANIFSRAVHQINLLQPEFVMSVGDLIEGYTQDMDRVAKEWDEFDSFTKNFDMPFFYVPGNHDLTNREMIEYWGGRYGKTYYHFVYKNTLFIAVNSEDGAANVISPAQQEAVKKALDENPNVRWTLVFLHKPLWAQRDIEKTGWLEIEKALEGRKYTVFCGHVHRYQKYVRNGMNYYQLATTGGVSKLRGPRYGEFDHIVWVTMKKDGPLLANILLDGILPEDLRLPDTEEPGQRRRTLPTEVVKGRITLDGQPLGRATVTFTMTQPPQGVRSVTADALTDDDGTFVLSTYTRDDGAPVGNYKVVVTITGRGYYDDEPPVDVKVPEKYTRINTTPLTFEVKMGLNEAVFDLKSD
jgi:hypothetical protein